MCLVESERSRIFTKQPLAVTRHVEICSGDLRQVLPVDFGAKHFFAAQLGEPMLFHCLLVLPRLLLWQTPLFRTGFHAITGGPFLFEFLLVLAQILCHLSKSVPSFGALVF